MIGVILYLTVFLAGVVFSLLVKEIIPFEYERWRTKRIQKVKTRQKWYEQVHTTASDIESVWSHKFTQAVESDAQWPDHDEIQKDLSRYADKLSKLEGRIEPDDNVDEDLRLAMTELIAVCHEIDDLPLHTQSTSDFEEREEDIRELTTRIRDLSTNEF